MGYNYEIFEKMCEMYKVTPYRVSQETGVSTATLSSWKLGRYEPKQDKIQKLADYFNVPVSTFQISTEVEGVHYIDAETAAIAQKLYENPELRVLFRAAVDSKVEDIQMAADMLKRFKETNPDG